MSLIQIISLPRPVLHVSTNCFNHTKDFLEGCNFAFPVCISKQVLSTPHYVNDIIEDNNQQAEQTKKSLFDIHYNDVVKLGLQNEPLSRVQFCCDFSRAGSCKYSTTEQQKATPKLLFNRLALACNCSVELTNDLVTKPY